jgi:hypothetical protein
MVLKCDEREVSGKRIGKKISGLIEHPPDGKRLEPSPLGVSGAEDLLRGKLVHCVSDSTASRFQ